MNCSSAEALFERFLDAGLTGRRERAFVAHVDGCGACRGVLEELRSVDALLDAPREVPLAANFTVSTMAHARALPAPASRRVPIRAYLVAYLSAVWLIGGAAYLFAPHAMHAGAQTVVTVARSVANASGGLAAVLSRLLGRNGNVFSTLLGALIVLDIVLVAAFSCALRLVRPGWMERLRS